jgi:tetratricopeptide (TPR) repeat protein
MYKDKTRCAMLICGSEINLYKAGSMNRISRWFPFILLAAGMVCYTNSFGGPFIFDDNRVILNNPHLFTLWPPWKAVLVPTRFVADISFALNFALGGLTPADYRVTNVLIHIVAGLLLYGVVRRTLELPRFGGRFHATSGFLAGASALLWIVHPLQTESVTYIAQRIEALMGLFYLLFFYCFIRGIQSQRPRLWMNAALVSCMVGMGTKEVFVTAPFVLLVYDGLFVSTSWRDVFHARGKLYVAMFLTLGIFALLLVIGMARAMGNGSLFVTVISPWQYAMTQSGVILHYVKLSFVPTSLCLSYRWPFAKSLGEVWAPATLIVVVLVITAAGLLRRKAFSFPLVWFFCILAPTSSIMPIADAAFEHRMYLPLAGLITGVVVGVYVAFERLATLHSWGWPWRRVLFGVLCLIAAWFTTLTQARNLDYRSEEAVWRDIVVKRPDNYNPYIALSREMIGENRLDEAYDILNQALTRMPDFSGIPFEKLREQFMQDVSLPCIPYAMAHNNLGIVYMNWKLLEDAKVHFKEAIRVFPSNHIGYFNMGRIALFQGQTNEAVRWWQDSLLRKPSDIDTLCLLAVHHTAQSHYSEAVSCYRKVLYWNPDHAFARAQLAWLLATCEVDDIRNGEEASSLARRLPGMSGGASPRAFDILAAAEAEAGNYDRAITAAETALSMAGSSPSLSPTNRAGVSENNADSMLPGDPNREAYINALEKRLLLYRQHRPYRAPR